MLCRAVILVLLLYFASILLRDFVRASQVISTARTCNMLLICLDVMKVRLMRLKYLKCRKCPEWANGCSVLCMVP